MSFGAGLAAFSVYHRYQMFTQLSGTGSAGSNENEMEGCEGGCLANSGCQWGVCHCLRGYLQAWGRCVLETDPDFHTSLHQPTRVRGTDCTALSECQASDINLVCRGSSRKQCECKDPTRWNSKTSECQIYIGVDDTVSILGIWVTLSVFVEFFFLYLWRELSIYGVPVRFDRR